MSFKEFLQEAKPYWIIALDDKTYLTDRYKFTDNLNRAYVFASFEDAIDYDEEHGNDIDGYTDIYKVTGKKLELVT